MVVRGGWKLNVDLQGKAEMYHLDNDPFELNNVYHLEKYQVIRIQLLEELVVWMMAHKIRCLTRCKSIET